MIRSNILIYLVFPLFLCVCSVRPIHTTQQYGWEHLTEDYRRQTNVRYSPGLKKRFYNASKNISGLNFYPQKKSLNFTNAKWLAHFSALQYSHFAYVDSELRDLGFRTKHTINWDQCAYDLEMIKLLERRYQLRKIDSSSLQSWGECARTWYTNEYIRKNRRQPRFIASKFAQYLFREPHLEKNIEFFSEGSIKRSNFVKGSTQVLWAHNVEKSFVIIVFRGTEVSGPQLLRDGLGYLDMDLKYLARRGRVHRGFYHGFQSVYTGLLEKKLDQIKGTDTHIWITGHSVGGSLATLLASEILARIDSGQRLQFAGLYTFGALRTGDQAFVRRFNRSAMNNHVQVFRFQHGNDRFPCLPRSEIGYRQAGQALFLDPKTRRYSIGQDEIPCRGVRAFRDHNIMDYYDFVAHLESTAERSGQRAD